MVFRYERQRRLEWLWDGYLLRFLWRGTDIPVVGDWMGTATPNIGVFRNGQWFLDLNGNGVWDGCGTDPAMLLLERQEISRSSDRPPHS